MKKLSFLLFFLVYGSAQYMSASVVPTSQWEDESRRIRDAIVQSAAWEHPDGSIATMAYGRGTWISDRYFLTVQHVGDPEWRETGEQKHPDPESDCIFLPEATVLENTEVKEEIFPAEHPDFDCRNVIIANCFASDDSFLGQYVLYAFKGIEVLKVEKRRCYQPAPEGTAFKDGIFELETDHPPLFAEKIPPTKIAFQFPQESPTQLYSIPLVPEENWHIPFTFIGSDQPHMVRWQLSNSRNHVGFFYHGVGEIAGIVCITNLSTAHGQSGAGVYRHGNLVGFVRGSWSENTFAFSLEDPDQVNSLITNWNAHHPHLPAGKSDEDNTTCIITMGQATNIVPIRQ